MNIAAKAQLSSADAGDNGSRSLPRRLLDLVFGYDFFISYSWCDGAAYASALARRLEADGFQVFLDRADYASGDDWNKVGAWTLRRTGQLVLVGSPAAIQSAPVIREVEIFSKTERRIVPIDFDGSTAPKQFAPMHQRETNGDVDAHPWCQGFYAAMRLRLPAWAPLLDASNVNHRLLLPILQHCRDDQGRPLLGPPRNSRDTHRNAYADIPAAVEALRQYWMPIRYPRPR